MSRREVSALIGSLRDVEGVGWSFAFAATAYNLVRLPKLLAAPA